MKFFDFYVNSWYNNSIAYAVKAMPAMDTNSTNMISSNDSISNTFITNDMTNEIITNTTTITNYNLSNISVYTNEEGITVKGQSNTIALMVVTNVITNIRYNELTALPPAASPTNIITNEYLFSFSFG